MESQSTLKTDTGLIGSLKPVFVCVCARLYFVEKYVLAELGHMLELNYRKNNGE